jgi:uncharacterized protein (TIGR03084 family)
MAASMPQLCDDLLAETAVLDALVRPLDANGWLTPTPAPGWTVHDQVAHLAHFDEDARIGAVDPERFAGMKDEVLRDVDAFVARATEEDRKKSGPEVLAWLHEQRSGLIAAVRDLDPSTRVPWYGPDMTVASSITARIMETWAHGQDCFDALGAVHAPSERLYHVAFIGSRALPNSFRAQGRAVPETPVRVELDGPGGVTWTFGPDDTDQVVRGPAMDFCLVVTQRRHPADTALVADGDVAREWLSIAQAFAGPPGAGRKPGQFTS